MITAQTIARIEVSRLFTRAPMSFRSLVNMIKVTTGIGRAKLRTTWLSTRVFVGSSPRAMAMSAGTIVAMRRIHTGTRNPTKPCMTTWPAIVPTCELEIPEAISEIRKIAAAPPPSRAVRVR